MQITENERWDVINALVIAASTAECHAKSARDFADRLRDGEQHPLFAAGEDGARACEVAAAQHEANASQWRRLADLAQQVDSITVTYSDDAVSID